MPNIKQIMDGHNKNQLSRAATTTRDDNACNCRNKAKCPMSNNCLAESIVYQATVSTNENKPPETYVGLIENSFKTIGMLITNRHSTYTRKGTQLNLVNIFGN